MNILIKHGNIIDPANNTNETLDILIKDSKIFKLDKNIQAKADEVIDAKDKKVIPGLVDMHVHLREPGREDQETIASGTSAAVKGGVTSVLAMPNTGIPVDSIDVVKLVKGIIKKDAKANVLIAGAITKGRLGRKLTDVEQLVEEGAIAITDDGSSVDDENIFSQALKKAKTAKLLTICHSEDSLLAKKGVVNLGLVSTILGLRGVSAESEYKRIERDIALAVKAKAKIHIAHVSCKESVGVIAKAKKKGINVTAETAPHYFSLYDELLFDYNTDMKINPPLRSKADVEAIKQGLCSGAIDCIASDHAPHTVAEKDRVFDLAPFGTIGLETALAVAITELIDKDVLSWLELVKKMSLNPARILKTKKGNLTQGSDADIAIIDPKKEWVVSVDNFVSKSHNSAFLGRKLKGVVEYTVVGGKIAYKNQK